MSACPRCAARELRLAACEAALRSAPMPYSESVLRGEDWDERYDEWWHKNASEAALSADPAAFLQPLLERVARAATRWRAQQKDPCYTQAEWDAIHARIVADALKGDGA